MSASTRISWIPHTVQMGVLPSRREIIGAREMNPPQRGQLFAVSITVLTPSGRHAIARYQAAAHA
jgi:hypothetical protein